MVGFFRWACSHERFENLCYYSFLSCYVLLPLLAVIAPPTIFCLVAIPDRNWRHDLTISILLLLVLPIASIHALIFLWEAYMYRRYKRTPTYFKQNESLPSHGSRKLSAQLTSKTLAQHSMTTIERCQALGDLSGPLPKSPSASSVVTMETMPDSDSAVASGPHGSHPRLSLQTIKEGIVSDMGNVLKSKKDDRSSPTGPKVGKSKSDTTHEDLEKVPPIKLATSKGCFVLTPTPTITNSKSSTSKSGKDGKKVATNDSQPADMKDVDAKRVTKRNPPKPIVVNSNAIKMTFVQRASMPQASETANRPGTVGPFYKAADKSPATLPTLHEPPRALLKDKPPHLPLARAEPTPHPYRSLTGNHLTVPGPQSPNLANRPLRPTSPTNKTPQILLHSNQNSDVPTITQTAASSSTPTTANDANALARLTYSQVLAREDHDAVHDAHRLNCPLCHRYERCNQQMLVHCSNSAHSRPYQHHDCAAGHGTLVHFQEQHHVEGCVCGSCTGGKGVPEGWGLHAVGCLCDQCSHPVVSFTKAKPKPETKPPSTLSRLYRKLHTRPASDSSNATSRSSENKGLMDGITFRSILSGKSRGLGDEEKAGTTLKEVPVKRITVEERGRPGRYEPQDFTAEIVHDPRRSRSKDASIQSQGRRSEGRSEGSRYSSHTHKSGSRLGPGPGFMFGGVGSR